MVFKITKPDQKLLNEGAQELQELRAQLEEGMRAYNDTVQAARKQLQQFVKPYEEKAGEIYALLDGIKNAAEEEFDRKSEDWKESDRGEATKEWIDALEDAMISMEDPLNLPETEELDAEYVFAEDLCEIILHLDSEPRE